MTSSFPATRWTVVVAAAGSVEGDPAAAQAALGELCGLYWYPLYAYARRRGLSPEDAEDATQSFFSSLLAENLFAAADPSLGRLRSFLLKAFGRDLADARRDRARQKRGGGAELIPLDLPEAESRFLAEPSGGEPVHRFERTWAATVLEGALRRVEADYAATGRAGVFTALRPCLGAGGAGITEPDRLAASLGLSDVALRQAISRLRDRFRTALRAHVADTLREPTEEAIDEELRSLRAVLAEGA